jgi:macrolide-specific efflux system membrane fusion protein
VTVSKNGSTESRTVTTGLTAGGMTEITSGLQAGEQVVITFPSFGGNRTANGNGEFPTGGFRNRTGTGGGDRAGGGGGN